MAAPGPSNMIARCVTDDLIAFSGETAPRRYMKYFLTQKLAESRRFVNHIRDEVDTLRDCVAQLTAVIVELQAMPNQDKVHDSLLADKDAKHSEQSKLVALNDVIAEALEDIETQETNVEILDDENDGVMSIRTWSSENGLAVIYIYTLSLKVLTMDALYILDKLAEVADSSRLQDKIKVVFVLAHGEDESFIALMRDLCSALREIVGRDSAMLGVLEQLLADTHVGMRLKASYVAEMEETKHNAWGDIPEKLNVFKNSVGYSCCWSRDTVDALQISSALL
ncbi:hypothetical protein Tco_0127090 [Tanacetum coccineum]